MRFVLGPARCFKYELKLLMTWKFGAPLATMYTPEIEARWGVEYHGVEVGTWICPKALSHMKRHLFINNVLLGKLQMMLGVLQLNFLPMMIWNKHNK
jgi:hypothetical protein